MYSFLARNILGPSLDRWRGWKAFKNLEALRRSQWWSTEELRKLQDKKLRGILQYAYEHVPYYHHLFDSLGLKPADIRGHSDLVKLPLLKKRIIQENFPERLVASDFPQEDLKPNCTGGSTGEPLKFYTTNGVRGAAAAAQYRVWEWFNIFLGDKCAMLVSNRFDIDRMSTLGERTVNFFRRWKSFRAFEVSRDTLASYVDELRRFKPKLLYGYPSTLALLSKYITVSGLEPFRPEAICSSGETLYPHQREAIEEAFACGVFNYYGTRELSVCASECPEKSGLHIAAENAVVEFIADGEQVSAGELGQLVITDFNNLGMPFIRYSVGDVGRPLEDKCPCGRGLPLVKWIEGRTSELIVTPEGKFIPPIFFPHLFKDVEGVNNFQVIQESPSELTVKVVKGLTYSKKDEDYLIGNMEQYLGKQVKINFLYVDSIPPSPTSGKRRVVVSTTADVRRSKTSTTRT